MVGTTPKRTDSSETYTIGTNVTVVVRVRPLSGKELEAGLKNCLHVDDNVVSVNKTSEYIFDHCIKHHRDNSYLYDKIGEPLLNHALDGYNVCLFAYGQTGSGKTHSILGRESDPGLMQQFVSNLFHRISIGTRKEGTLFKVECSYYEIYNEKIYDLLGNDCRVPLRVREHPINGPYIVDLSTIECTSYDDAMYWINIAQKRRLTAFTLMNQKSSRSHTIFTLNIVQDKDLDDEFKQSITSKVNIVDLAGSERSHSTSTTNERIYSPVVKSERQKESVLINKSLLTLGKVITQLSEHDIYRGSSINYISYRESTLTWLLRESLGGNSKTTMIATVSPTSLNLDETVTTLRYAAQARRVVNIVKINEDPKIRRIRELEHEVEILRQRLALMESPSVNRGRGSSISYKSTQSNNSSPEESRRRSRIIEANSPIYKPDTLLQKIKEIFADILNERNADKKNNQAKLKN